MNKLTTTQQSGLTLVELLITMSMVAILSAFAFPSYQEILNNGRQTSALNVFQQALSIARSEAIKQGVQTVVCTSDDGAACGTSLNWDQGWLVYVDSDADSTLDSGELIVHVGGALDEGLSLDGDSGIAVTVRYQENGDSIESGTITLCDSRGASEARAVIVTAAGKSKISDTASGGGALTCS